MNRRGFLGVLLGGAAIAADPERLLWVRGKTLYSIGPPRIYTVSDLISEAMNSMEMTPWPPLTPEMVAAAYRRVNGMFDDWMKEPIHIHRIPDPFYPGIISFSQDITKEELRRLYPDKALL